MLCPLCVCRPTHLCACVPVPVFYLRPCFLWKCTQCSEEGVNMCAGLNEALCPSLSPPSIQPLLLHFVSSSFLLELKP